jgi:NAD(P)-dependent dehydrogenase (short-subunit alcohol dehydrogenase family)
MPQFSLAGATILVTGAAGDIGAATAAMFGREGASVVITDRKKDDLDRVAATLSDGGVNVHAIGCDQTDPLAVSAMFAELSERGPLKVAFVNAGYGSYGALIDQEFKIWKKHVDVNLNGSFLIATGAARLMAKSGSGGAIVFNASTAANHVCDLLGAYAASKAGVAMLARSLASELGIYGIRVNTILPGVIETKMTSTLLDDAATRADVLRETPVGRLGKAEDIANLVGYLCSEKAGYISGAEILVDGGQTIHGYPRWFRVDYGETNEWRPQSSVRA